MLSVIEPVIYSRLAIEPEPEFRLVKIERSPDLSSPIVCTLHVSSLESAPTYDALSYAWGDAETTKSMLLLGRRWPVNFRLFQALTGMRNLDTGWYIWIDAVCINQDDWDEWRSQVSLIGCIYARAAGVQVWLDTIEFVAPFLGQVIDISDGRNTESVVATLVSKVTEWRPLTAKPG